MSPPEEDAKPGLQHFFNQGLLWIPSYGVSFTARSTRVYVLDASVSNFLLPSFKTGNGDTLTLGYGEKNSRNSSKEILDMRRKKSVINYERGTSQT